MQEKQNITFHYFVILSVSYVMKNQKKNTLFSHFVVAFWVATCGMFAGSRTT